MLWAYLLICSSGFRLFVFLSGDQAQPVPFPPGASSGWLCWTSMTGMACTASFLKCGKVILKCGQVILKCGQVKLKCGQVILKCNQITLKCTRGILKCGQVSTKMWSSHTEMWLGHTEMCSGNTEMQLGQTECGQVIPKCDGEVMLIHTMCLVSYCKWWAVRICTVYVASLHWYGYGLSWPLLILWLPYYSVYNNINGGTFGGEGVGSI